jgi:hypothetical protein
VIKNDLHRKKLTVSTVEGGGENEKYNIHAKKVPIDRSLATRFAA